MESENDIINRINKLCETRSWSYYKLAKESGITYSTLCTMIHKSNSPSVPTLLKICKGFGITVGEFFDEESPSAELTEDQKKCLALWSGLSDEDKRCAEKFLAFLAHGAND